MLRCTFKARTNILIDKGEIIYVDDQTTLDRLAIGNLVDSIPLQEYRQNDPVKTGKGGK